MESELDEPKRTEEIDDGTWIEDLIHRIGRLSAEERAYQVIRSYLSGDRTDERASANFLVWLCSEHNAEVKERAMKRFFDEQTPEKLHCEAGVTKNDR